MTTFTWSFGVRDYIAPWIDNQTPTGTGIAINTSISVDILDDYSGVNLSSIDAYADGNLAFSGPSTFIAPYNGPGSSILPTTIDGYDGYHLILDRTANYAYVSWHTIQINCNDNYGNALVDSWNFYTSNAVKSLITGPYEITFDLEFFGSVTNDLNLINSANYVFNNGAYVRKIDVLSSNSVRLWTEFLYGNNRFVLNVYNILDEYGNVLAPEKSSAYITPFQSSAQFSNTSGLVRTWRESELIHADTYRVYLSGEKGIDVFKKVSINYDRWAQIFDSYGVSAMYIANYPSDLRIVDSTAPYFTNQVPAPGAIVDADTTIQFSIFDGYTAVEIVDTHIYVNNILVFDGINGWQNGYGGSIEIDYQTLNIILYPPSNFSAGSIVFVRAVAYDLLNNKMDSQYLFGITPIGSSGLGFSGFGSSSFGGI